MLTPADPTTLMPLRFRNSIIAHLRDHRYQPRDLDQLAELLNVENDELPEFEASLDQLQSKGSIHVDDHGRFTLPPAGKEIVGKIKVHPKGFAFIIPDIPNREGDLFVPADNTGGAVTGDIVRAKVLRDQWARKRSSSDSPYIGRVEEIIQRGRTTFVGTLRKRGKAWMVEIDGRFFAEPLRVRDVRAKDAREGDKIVVEVIRFPDDTSWGEAVITKRLGEAGVPDVETQAVIHAFDLPPDEFPEECITQARQITRSFKNINDHLENREDIRNEFILTIDPPDARDYDDAISIESFKQGAEKDNAAYELGVHIADVGYFIDPDSPLDLEARERGNSVYLPRHVIPMLPEILSNGICSLQEGVDRLTKSVFIRFDQNANVISSRTASTIIRSDKRLTYLEAEALIKGDTKDARDHAMSESEYPDQLIPKLKRMDDLAGRIRGRRLKDGMIVLTLPEVELIFDDDGHVIGAEPEDDASTHGLIEMFMVEANEAVARLFDELRVPILRRTHPDPSTFDLGELRKFCRVAGINIPKHPSQEELQHILEATRGKPTQQAIHLAVLKSLTRAEYSPALIGHFALASEDYAHFTSPIRRYPDLTLHRSLGAYLELTENGRRRPNGKGIRKLGKTLRRDDRCPDEAELIEIGRHCSDTERTAESAERSLRTFLVLQYIEQKHMGDIFDGTVVNISSNAIWVQLDHLLAEGMVFVRDIPIPEKKSDDKSKSGEKKKNDRLPSYQHGRRHPRWSFNSDTCSLVAEGTGAAISIGDRMKVQVMKINPTARQLDLRITENNKKKSNRTPRPKTRK